MKLNILEIADMARENTRLKKELGIKEEFYEQRDLNEDDLKKIVRENISLKRKMEHLKKENCKV